MKKDELKKHINRASDILVKVARQQRSKLPSIKEEAEVMKQELKKVGALDKMFLERSKEVLAVLKKRKPRR